jgi:iron-sulfur cluster assembly protein
MSITVSNRAADRIHQLENAQNFSDDVKLRVGVVSGGCSGLTYELDFDEGEPDEAQKDQLFEDNGIKLIVICEVFYIYPARNSIIQKD